MRGAPLTPIVIMREIGRLLDELPRPKRWPPETEVVARRWADICHDVSAEQFTQAVTAYLGDDQRFMPNAGKLRTLALQQRGAPGGNGAGGSDEYAQWAARSGTNREGRLTPCPACGRAWAWYRRLYCVHDHARHRALGLPCIGKCDAPSCIGPPAIPPWPIVPQSDGPIWDPAESAAAAQVVGHIERAAMQQEGQ